jgi:hypothetical protein
MSRSRLVFPAVGLVLATVLSGCFTGKRAASTPDTSPAAPATSVDGATGPTTTVETSPILETVAVLLGQSAKSPETATYSVRPTSRSTATPVTVSRDADRTVVSIRNIEYRITARGSRTCRRDTHKCVPGLDAQPISDLLISATFWGPAARQALRAPGMVAKGSSATTSTLAVAGQSAMCVTIPGPNVNERYCALPTGMLAAENTVRVDIALTTYNREFAQALWDEFPES